MDDAKFDETLRRFEDQAARAAQIKDSFAELKGSARNGDGSVTVTVAPSGAVLGLALSPAAMNRSHTQLTQEILGTIRQAQQQAAAAMEAAIRPAIGDELFERFQTAFRAHSDAVEPLGPTTPPPAASMPAAGAPARAPRPVRQPDDDGGDFSEQNIMRDRR